MDCFSSMPARPTDLVLFERHKFKNGQEEIAVGADGPGD